MKNIYKVALALLILLIGQNAQAQYCNPIPTVNTNTAPYTSPDGSALRLRLHINLIRKSDGTGGRSLSDAHKAICDLNIKYAPFDIFFTVVGFSHIDDDSLYFFPSTRDWSGTIFPAYSHNNAIDFYILDDTDFATTNVNSISSPTSTISFIGFALKPGSDFVVGGVQNGKDLLHSLVPCHEMGHCLGLWHTDHVGIGPSACVELVNGSHCTTCSDFICDTHADPGLGVFNVDTNTCLYNGIAVDSNNQSYSPLVSNIMSHSPFQCMQNFTSGQGAAMRDTIQNHSLLIPCTTSVIDMILIMLLT